MSSPPDKAVLDALIYGVKLKTPIAVDGKVVTVLNLRGIKGRDLRRIKDPYACRDELIALSARIPESLVLTMDAEEKELALVAIRHVCGLHLTVMK